MRRRHPGKRSLYKRQSGLTACGSHTANLYPSGERLRRKRLPTQRSGVRPEWLEDRRLLSLDPLWQLPPVVLYADAPAEQVGVHEFGGRKTLGGTPEGTRVFDRLVASGVHPDRLIIRFAGGLVLTEQQAALANAGATLIRPLVGNDVVLVGLPPGADLFSTMQVWNASPLVLYAEPDYVFSLLDTFPNDQDFVLLYGLHNTGQTGGTVDADIDAPAAWDSTTGSTSVVVGVIDTGIAYNHSDLAANMWANPGETAGNGIDDDGNGFIDDVYGWDFINNDNDPFDDHGHGTHVAGTIGGVGNNGVGVVGVAWNVSLMALKFLDAGGFGSLSDAISAVQYATMMKQSFGVNVVATNNSWGGGGFSQALYDAIAEARDANILFVAAAGNDGSDNDEFPAYPATYDLENIVAVAATDHNDQLASFSNYGATTVDLAAPGVHIYSTLPANSFGYLSGTSMATPHVAGTVALLASLAPSAGYATLRDALLAGVDPLENLNGLVATGGRLNARGALAQLFVVLASEPARGSVVSTVPLDYVVHFSQPYDPGSVQASDLAVDGTPADSVTLTDADTLTFHFSTPPFSDEGPHTITMAQGAVVSAIAGRELLAYNATFFYDTLVLQVVSTDPPNESTAAVPLTQITLNFNEEYDQNSLDPDDLVLDRGRVTRLTFPSATSATFLVAGLAEEGSLSFRLPAGRVTDRFGNPNMAFDGTLDLDVVLAPYPGPLVRVPPAGSLTFDPEIHGLMNGPGDVDEFFIDLQVGSVLAVVIDPDPNVNVLLEVFDPFAGLLGSVAVEGVYGVLNTMILPADGTYTIRVTGDASTARGDYFVQVALNAAIELESRGGLANDTLATAQDITDSFIALDAFARRAAVMDISDVTLPLGPDGFGYEALPVPFVFEDIRRTGTPILVGDIDAFAELSETDLAGFTFTFYGRTYTNLFVSTKGILTFESGTFNWMNSALDSSPPQPTIAALWDNLAVAGSTGAAVYWQVDGTGNDQRLIVQWNDVLFFENPGGGTITFQVVLSEADGTIQFNYLDLDVTGRGAEGASATVGIKDAGVQGDRRLLVSFNEGPSEFVGTGRSTLIGVGVGPVFVDYYSFELNAGETATLALASILPAEVRLLDATGALLAVGMTGAENVTQAIAEFVAGDSGTYYVQISGRGEFPYHLAVLRNVVLDFESIDQEMPQPLQAVSADGTLRVLGYSETGTPPVIEFDEAGEPPPPATGVVLEGVSFRFERFGRTSAKAVFGAPGPESALLDSRVLAGPSDGFLWLEFAHGLESISFAVGLATAAHVSRAVTVDYFDINGIYITSDLVDTANLGFGVSEAAVARDFTTPVYQAVFYFASWAAPIFYLDNLGTTRALSVDRYTFVAAEGATLVIGTQTPFRGPLEPINNTDPFVRLLDTFGVAVASDDNFAGDGVNALIRYVVPAGAGGVYTIEVTTLVPAPLAAPGEYLLTIEGGLPNAQPFLATAISPLDGARLPRPPVFALVEFNDGVLLSSVQPEDLTLDGVPAVAVTVVGGNLLRFDLPSLADEGPHTLEIAAGAILDLQATPLAAFVSQYVLDYTPPVIVSSSIQQGDALAPAFVEILLEFSESMNSGNLTLDDISIVEQLTGAFVPVSYIFYDVAAQVLTLGVSLPAEGLYELTLFSGDRAFEDVAGNDLDGEPQPPGRPIPPNTSGDGVAGGNFVLTFSVDASSPGAPADYPPLQAKEPLGSLIYDPTVSGAISTADDVDEYTIIVDAGQVISARVVGAYGLVAFLEILAPDNSVLGSDTAAAPQGQAIVQTVPAAAGTYRIRVSGAGGSLGTYSVQLVLNAAIEDDRPETPSNDAIPGQNIDASFVTIGSGAARGAVLGRVDVQPIGPDAFGYVARPVPFEFLDISTTGTAVLVGADDGFTEITAADLNGFAFTFYGTTYTNLFVSTNGIITFGEGTFEWANSPLDLTPLQPTIAAYWDDLSVTGGPAAAVYWEVQGTGTNQRLILQWQNAEFGYWWGFGTITFQVILNEADGSIQFNYLDLDADVPIGEGASATVGIKDADVQGGNRLLVSFNSGPNSYVGSGRSTLIGLGLEVRAPDVYEFSALAGEALTIAASAIGRGFVTIELRDAANALLASGTVGPANVDQVIDNFVAPATGTYYVSVAGTTDTEYSVTVLRGAAFDLEWNSSFATAQPLAGRHVALGALVPEALLEVRSGFEGLAFPDSGGFRPPDTHAAAGVSHIVEVVNSTVAFFNKATGVREFVQSLTDFFGPVDPGMFVFDPVVAYDELAGRFIVAALDVDFDAETAALLYAVSNTGNPHNGFDEMHKIDVIDDIGGTRYWGDYPKIGWNADAHVITLNMFSFGGFFFNHVSVISLDKTTVLDADPATITFFDVDRSDGVSTMAAATMHGAAPGDPMWFVTESPVFFGFAIRIVQMDNVLSAAPVFTDYEVFVTPYHLPPPAPQQGSTETIDTNDSRVLNAEFRGGHLVATHTVGLNDEAKARWYDFVVSNIGAVLAQQGTIDPGPGIHTYYPSIAVNQEFDIGLTYMQSSAAEFISMYVTGRRSVDPPGTMRTPLLVRAGEATYSDPGFSVPHRAGDYSGITVDPVDGLSFWAANEYATSAAASNWGTYIAQFALVDGIGDDWYRISVSAGELIKFISRTPGAGPGEPVNELDPRLEIYDPSGNLVATGAVLGDGRNEIVQHTAAEDGEYRLRVARQNGSVGTYVVERRLSDDTAGILVNPTSGLVTTEAGGTATFTVVLTSQPMADVTIDVRSSNTAEGTVNVTSLTFTAANWNVEQTVTVTGVDDGVDDGDVGYTIILLAASSTDPTYDGLNPDDVSVTNVDDDASDIAVTDNSDADDDQSIQFTTNLSSYRRRADNSPLVRPNYPDNRHFFKVTNAGLGPVTLFELVINAPDVSVDVPLTSDPSDDIVLGPRASQTFVLTYAPTLPSLSNPARQNFDLANGIVVLNDSNNLPNLNIRLRGQSTYNSDITYDGRVNLSEVGVLNANFGRKVGDPNWDPTADINGDGRVNLGDLGMYNAEFGRGVGGASFTSSSGSASGGRSNSGLASDSRATAAAQYRERQTGSANSGLASDSRATAAASGGSAAASGTSEERRSGGASAAAASDIESGSREVRPGEVANGAPARSPAKAAAAARDLVLAVDPLTPQALNLESVLFELAAEQARPKKKGAVRSGGWLAGPASPD